MKRFRKVTIETKSEEQEFLSLFIDRKGWKNLHTEGGKILDIETDDPEIETWLKSKGHKEVTRIG